METYNIISAQYKNNIEGTATHVEATIDGQEMIVPMVADNRHYAEIMRQVEAGTLVVAEAG